MTILKDIEQIAEVLGIKCDEAAELYTDCLWGDNADSFLRGVKWLLAQGFTITRHPSELAAHFQQECSPQNCNSGRCCS